MEKHTINPTKCTAREHPECFEQIYVRDQSLSHVAGIRAKRKILLHAYLSAICYFTLKKGVDRIIFVLIVMKTNDGMQYR
jgi:hypothetical protein